MSAKMSRTSSGSVPWSGGASAAPVRGAVFARANLACLTLLLLAAGCRLDMHVQPRYNPYDASDFFSDGRSARQPVAGTVPRGANIAELADSDATKAGDTGSANASAFPFAVTREVLSRGRERYDIFCAPCHGLAGDGDGVIVQRGFQAPPSYHLDRLRSAPASHFFDVITNGFGAMYPYGYRVPIADRWAIVSYIRALQLSRQGTIDEVPPAERQKLMSEPQ
jgi:mono/diheme cytochrome c family protein